ncbi:DUF2269 family protein [Conexibacter arvalis]|uniref:Putative membrane protein n=1 Tax=Conexibacter arvalis TaxID=912552 RepID=A0A840IKK2_9ACTN|nr:DUF2269 family protein [Conexibacter arvalis]MBB4664761.1 putative membrane protein [Conexibacter arvalis]
MSGSGARDVALFLHLLGVIALLAGIAIAAVAHARARREESTEAVVVLLRLARTGVLLAAPAALLVVGAGAWLVSIQHLAWDTGWLRTAIALFVVSLVLGAAGGRRPRQARELAERLRTDGRPPNDALRALLDDRASLLANAASAIAMLVVLWLMVAKP